MAKETVTVEIDADILKNIKSDLPQGFSLSEYIADILTGHVDLVKMDDTPLPFESKNI